MAYMNKERKAERAPAIKKILKKYGLKGSLSVRNYSTLALKIKDVRGLFESHMDDFKRNWGLSINPYHYNNFSPEITKLFDELTAAMYGKDYFDHSDPMTDYFHTSHYISIDVFPAN